MHGQIPHSERFRESSVGTHGCLSPRLGLHSYEADSLFTYTVRWNTKMGRYQVAWFPSRRICRRES